MDDMILVFEMSLWGYGTATQPAKKNHVLFSDIVLGQINPSPGERSKASLPDPTKIITT